MAGVYIHIPFCKSRCRYCDFFSTTRLEHRKAYIAAVEKEAESREKEIHEIKTFYIGGGTPSLIDPQDIERLIRVSKAQKAIEKTLEANPQDITQDIAEQWLKAGINRLSIGIQSFDDRLLRLMGRRHDARQAEQAVETAQKAGFDNISIDLIYALPWQTIEMLLKDLEKALSLDIQHLSCYCLSFEENTPFARDRDSGLIQETDEDTANAMYDLICSETAKKGINRYEVSNFACQGREAQHNSSYWTHTPYIGLGAGAHSYDGCRTRRANLPDINKYIASPSNAFTTETLTDTDIYNENIMLGLRTSKGIDRTIIRPEAEKYLSRHLTAGLLEEAEGRIRATQKGIHILNEIITDLMI